MNNYTRNQCQTTLIYRRRRLHVPDVHNNDMHNNNYYAYKYNIIHHVMCTYSFNANDRLHVSIVYTEMWMIEIRLKKMGHSIFYCTPPLLKTVVQGVTLYYIAVAL